MPDILDGINMATVGLTLCGLCVVGIILIGALQIIGGALGFFGNILEFGLGLMAGGPIVWVGCLVVLGLCMGCALVASLGAGIFSTCGTPQEVRFCVWFGF